VTALISPRGVILEEVWDVDLLSYHKPGFIAGQLELFEPRATFYTRWGDWIVILSGGLIAFGFFQIREVT
jgi:apolipoprotein N-acyltransferase